MKIYKAKNLGFCYGVRRSLSLVESASGKVYTYGHLIHNSRIVEELEKRGYAPSMM